MKALWQKSLAQIRASMKTCIDKVRLPSIMQPASPGGCRHFCQTRGCRAFSFFYSLRHIPREHRLGNTISQFPGTFSRQIFSVPVLFHEGLMKLAVGRVVRQDGCLQNKAIRQRWEALCEQSSSGLSAPASMLESPELLIPSTTDRKGIISSAIHKSFAIFGG